MNQDKLSDYDLWKRFLEGDSNAFSQIYNQTVQELFRLGLLYTSDRELIKDCIHDVFIKIHTNRAKLAPTDNIIAYLTIALKNTLINSLKKTSSLFLLEELNKKGLSDEDHTFDLEATYIHNEQEMQNQTTVQTMMSMLTERQREIIYYRYIQDKSIDEISKITDMNYQSVSNSIQRALVRIRNLFKKR